MRQEDKAAEKREVRQRREKLTWKLCSSWIGEVGGAGGGGWGAGTGQKTEEVGGVSIQRPIIGGKKKQLDTTDFKRYMLCEVGQQGGQEQEQVQHAGFTPRGKPRTQK